MYNNETMTNKNLVIRYLSEKSELLGNSNVV